MPSDSGSVPFRLDLSRGKALDEAALSALLAIDPVRSPESVKMRQRVKQLRAFCSNKAGHNVTQCGRMCPDSVVNVVWSLHRPLCEG